MRSRRREGCSTFHVHLIRECHVGCRVLVTGGDGACTGGDETDDTMAVHWHPLGMTVVLIESMQEGWRGGEHARGRERWGVWQEGVRGGEHARRRERWGACKSARVREVCYGTCSAPSTHQPAVPGPTTPPVRGPSPMKLLLVNR
jgi:hypothetical protein